MQKAMNPDRAVLQPVFCKEGDPMHVPQQPLRTKPEGKKKIGARISMRRDRPLAPVVAVVAVVNAGSKVNEEVRVL